MLDRFRVLVRAALAGATTVACAASVSGAALPQATDDAFLVGHEGFVTTADSVLLFYRVVGAGRDTAVVVHGGPGFGLESLAADLAPLARNRVLIFYDQRGGGRSTLLTDSARLTIADHVADLAAIVAHFRLTHPALIGHSWGAGLVVRYAARHAGSVGPLVLLEPVVPRIVPYYALFNEGLVARATPDELTAFAEASSAARLAVDPLASCRARSALLMRLWGGPDSVRGRVKANLCAMSANAYRAVQEHTTPATNASLQSGDLRVAAAAITAPVLLVWGLADPTPAAAIHEWEAGLRNVTVVPVAAAGHFAHAERPDVVLPAIESFLREAGRQ